MKKTKAKTKKPRKADIREGNEAANRFASGMAQLLAGGPQPKAKK